MIIEKLQKDLVSAQKEKAAQKVLVIRYLISQIRNYEIEIRVENRSLTDEDALLVLKRQIKRRKKAIEEFEKGNRPDIVAQEASELSIVEKYYSDFAQELGVSLE